MKRESEHRDDHFSEFRGHTLLKHGVLHRYVKAWIQILKKRHKIIWILDGFAGPGKDEAGNLGSPLLLARIAAQLQEPGCEVRLWKGRRGPGQARPPAMACNAVLPPFLEDTGFRTAATPKPAVGPQ